MNKEKLGLVIVYGIPIPVFLCGIILPSLGFDPDHIGGGFIIQIMSMICLGLTLYMLISILRHKQHSQTEVKQ